jgi:hypothetical protein
VVHGDESLDLVIKYCLGLYHEEPLFILADLPFPFIKAPDRGYLDTCGELVFYKGSGKFLGMFIVRAGAEDNTVFIISGYFYFVLLDFSKNRFTL